MTQSGLLASVSLAAIAWATFVVTSRDRKKGLSAVLDQCSLAFNWARLAFLHTLCWSRPRCLARNRFMLPGRWGAALAGLEILVQLGLGRRAPPGAKLYKEANHRGPLAWMLRAQRVFTGTRSEQTGGCQGGDVTKMVILSEKVLEAMALLI